MADKIQVVIEAKDAFSNVFASLTNALGINIMQFTTWQGVLGAVVKLEREAIQLAADEQTSYVELGATIKSMGLEASLSADGVRKLSEALMQTTNFEHEDLEAASQVFMRMESFDPSNLEKMLQVTADFAAGTGQNAASAAQAIATALETGNTRALRFSATQRTMIQDMIKGGDTAGAFNKTMEILGQKFGGQAAAQLNTYNGQFKALKQNWQEVLAAIGGQGMAEGQGIVATLNKAAIAANQLMSIIGEGQNKKPMEGWEKVLNVFTFGLINTYHTFKGVNEAIKDNAKYAEMDKLSVEEMGRAANYAQQNVLGLGDATADASQDVETMTKALKDQTGWELAYSGMDTYGERSKSVFDQLGGQLQGLGLEGSQVWDGLLVNTGKISPEAIAEFVKIQSVIQTVKDMLAKGFSIDMVVNFITTQSGVSLAGTGDPFERYKGMGGRGGGGNSTLHQAWLDYWNGKGTRPTQPDPGFANGGDFWVNQPTRILVGEGGQPEHVQITPASQGGGNSGPQNFYGPVTLVVDQKAAENLMDVR